MSVYEIRCIQADRAEWLAATGVKSAETLLEIGRTSAGRSDRALRPALHIL